MLFPRKAKLFHFGINSSTQGAVKVRSVAQARAIVARQGTRLVQIDSEHDRAVTLGWGKLAYSARGGLYLTDIRWHRGGRDYLRERSKIYFSPWFLVDDAGNVVELLNVALTSNPATRFCESLVTV